MENIILRPADPERDFGQLAVWFTMIEDEINTEANLKTYYEKNRCRITQRVAENEQGELLGFYWATHAQSNPELIRFDLFVKPERRQRGIGRQLYEDMLHVVEAAQAKKMCLNIRDTSPESREFAERRGFTKRSYSIAMALNLDAFDDRIYDKIIARLQGEGFQFTSMEALGNTEDVQRKLYDLNEMTGMEAPGSEGVRSWTSFEDFQKKVCQADWYKPAGQMVVIDTATGVWAGMSAISRFDDYAYNLHTGVDKRYRGRQLGQAIKVIALRYARDVLQVSTVRTHHNALNAPMIAIDCKFGYVQTSGTFSMEKDLDVPSKS